MKKYAVSGPVVLVCTILWLGQEARSQTEIQYTTNPGIYVSMDAPWSVISVDTEFPVIIYLKRGNEYPVTLKRITVTNVSFSKVAEYPGPDIWISDPFFLYAFTLIPTAFGDNYSVGDSVDIYVEVELEGDEQSGGIYKKHLRVYIGEPLPFIPNWYPGDTHFHTDFTDNPLEWGAGLFKGGAYSGDAILRRMGKAIGLNWVTVTDHSCDFGDDKNDTASSEEDSQWKDMEQMCLFENANDNTFKIIPAEEVTTSVSGGIVGRIHLLAYNTHRYIDGPEIAIEWSDKYLPFSDHWANGLLSLDDVLKDVESSQGSPFCFAAHPKSEVDPIGLLLKKWPDSAYKTALDPSHDSFKGLEVWNTRKRKWKRVTNKRDVDPFPWITMLNWHGELNSGIAQWDTLLRKNLNPLRQIFIEGGSDAHGDFNYSTSDRILGRVYDNAFGIVRTYVYLENTENGPTLTEENILNTLKNGRSVVTDGPLVIFGIDKNMDSELKFETGDVIPGNEVSLPLKSNLEFLVKWVSNRRYRDIDNGRVKKLSLVWGNASRTRNGAKATPQAMGNSYVWPTPEPDSPMRCYYRVEARVTDDLGTIYYRAFTNPIWINWTAPLEVPTISLFKINSDALRTGNRIVTLNNSCKKSPTDYRASERSDLSDAAWQSYSASPKFTITSAGNGTKKIYFQVKNGVGTSTAKSDTITLNEKLSAITSFSINSDADATTSRSVTLNNTASKYPLYYRASESPDFGGAGWKDYSSGPSFEITSSGDGEKTVYFQVKNGAGESAAMSDSINLDTGSSGEINWTQKFPVNTPGARARHAMAYDATRGQVVLFGGGYLGALDETWVWDGDNWTLKNPTNKPSARYDHAMAYDAARGQVVLFGGISGSAKDDTWVWDGNDWTLKNPTNKPSARIWHAMAYDAARGQVVLFGGWVGTYKDDTWVWDGNDWTLKNPTNKPSGRDEHGMAYDEARAQVVLFGGWGGAYKDDTWVWSGNDWTLKNPTNKPSGRDKHGMAYDAARGQVVLFGGGFPDDETWVWGPTTTSQARTLKREK